MAGTDKRKQSLFFPEDMLKKMQNEAIRQNRSLSWIVQKAWQIAYEEIKQLPAGDELSAKDEDSSTHEYE
jgi:uncharacterized small protein (TIGR04563 family)